MVKLVKAEGRTDVTLVNTDTNSSLSLGRLNLVIKKILEEAGRKIDHDYDEFNIEIDSDEIKQKLIRIAMPMKKPIRTQTKKVNNDKKPIVDVLDIIYGISK